MANYSLGEAVLETRADMSGLKKGLDKGRRTSKSLFSKAGGMLGNALSVAAGIGITKLPGMIMGVGKSIIGMVEDAGQLQQVSNTFDSLTASIGTTSDVMLVEMRGATRGMVSDADLMQASNKLMSMGLASSTEEAGKLAEMATQLGSAMGEDATASMENFALMMANQSIPRLDSFGISSGKVRERIKELMDATEGLTREQAFNQAVMEQGAEAMKRVGEQGGGAAGSMARLKTSFANIKDTLMMALLPYAEKVLTWISTLVD